MDKNSIKKYAVWARRELISRVSQKALQYGVSEKESIDAAADTVNGHLLSGNEKTQRQALISRIKQIGYQQTMEEAAYTWFNRFSALRFMEVNGYLPTHVRIFTDEQNAFKPQILAEAIHMELDGLSMDKVYELKDANKTDELYKYLVITQCNALSAVLPGMFTRIEDYTELLFPDNLLREGSVIEQMISMIPEEDWKDAVQIIGWLYQYYNVEPKDKVFADLKKNIKISKENIPAATQLFTPDWIVRYMVENSLGRIYVDKRKNEGIYADGRGLDEMTWHEAESERIATEKLIADKMGWKYYLPEAEQTQEVRKQLDEIQNEYATLDVKDNKVIDPCMGSGHILVYAFDVLMQIYEASGYSQRDAAQSILENNLYGLDIDDRAAQLAYFAVMMKARQYDRRIFSRGIQPHVYAIVESNGLDSSSVDYFTNNDPQLKKDFGTLMNELRDAKEYGSILNISQVDFAALYARVEEVRTDISMFREIVLNSILPLIQTAEVMAQKYDVVVTNPPYMAVSNAGAKVNNYVKKYFPDSKSDMFAVFIERCGQMAKKNGYQAMITQHSWMFLSSFEKLRTKLLAVDIVNMAHLGARAFEEIGGEVVQTTSFVIRKSHIADYKGEYCRLIEPTSQQGKEDMFLSGENRYAAVQSNFSKIPGSPVAYNFSEKVFRAFEAFKPLPEYGITRLGMTTASNETFVRLWFEVEIRRCYLDATNAEQVLNAHLKWVPYNKGGLFRRWFGNMDCVVNWENDGYEIKHFGEDTGHIRSTVPNTEYYFLECGTWSKISSGKIAVRYRPVGSIFDVAGACLYSQNRTNLYLLIAFLNSNVAMKLLSVLSPTMNFEGGHISSLPICIPDKNADYTTKVENCISISKDDWDSYETSWDFKRNPLAVSSIPAVFGAEYCGKYVTRLEDHYYAWKNECKERFENLQINEEELNRIFIDIYGLQDELTPDVADKDVTVHRVFDSKDDVPESMKGSNYVRTMRDEIVSLISYAVGCMFGRYSLDVDGLAYAGGEWDESRYKTIVPDSDNIIPICDDDYFDDDITGRFVKWVEAVYGKDTLEENLKFIADALGGKGPPRDVIRGYFLNDFYSDHCKSYQKRPIYWLFDSGKKNGFKALIYMHRYKPDIIARMRTDYVHEQQSRYRTAIADLESRIANADTGSRVKLTKQLTKLQNQAEELRVYEEKIHHLADQMIRIDLDDGVKHNYEIFKDVLAKIK